MNSNDKNFDNENLDNLLDDDILSEWEWAVSLNNLKKKRFKLEKKNKIFIYLFILLFLIFSIIFWVNYFFTLTLNNNLKSEFDERYLSSVKKYILPYISNVISNNTNWFKLSVDSKKSLIDMKQYTNNNWILFYDKKENKNKYIKNFTNNVNKKLKSIKNSQQLITKYRYLPKKLSEILDNSKLMPILITLNAIKLYLADYVFIKLWRFDNIYNNANKNSTFDNSFLLISKKDLRYSIEKDIARFREEWVALYLKDILFNYMYNVNDSAITNSIFINDFKNRFNKELHETYIYIKAKNNLNMSFDKFVKNYVLLFWNIYLETNNLYENKLVIDSLPINVQLLSYDPKKQTLSFSIKLLLENKSVKWKNISIIPLASKIIYLLRESRLIIGKNIKQDKLKVNKITKKIAWQRKHYNSINLSFTTSVQSNVNVEVSDVNK